MRWPRSGCVRRPQSIRRPRPFTISRSPKRTHMTISPPAGRTRRRWRWRPTIRLCGPAIWRSRVNLRAMKVRHACRSSRETRPPAARGRLHESTASPPQCPELEVARRSDCAIAGPISAYCHPERSEQRERSRRILDLGQLLSSSATHSESSGLARSLALSFSRVAAARRIPVLPHVLQRNSGFLARAGHARGNDRRPSGRAVSLSCAGLNSRLLKKAFSTAGALTLVSPEAGEKIRKEASFTQGVESLLIAILGFPGVFQHPARRAACFSAAHLRSAGCARSGVHRRRPSRLGLPAH